MCNTFTLSLLQLLYSLLHNVFHCCCSCALAAGSSSCFVMLSDCRACALYCPPSAQIANRRREHLAQLVEGLRTPRDGGLIGESQVPH